MAIRKSGEPMASVMLVNGPKTQERESAVEAVPKI